MDKQHSFSRCVKLPVCCLAKTEAQLLGAFNKVAATNFRDDVDDGIACCANVQIRKVAKKSNANSAGLAEGRGRGVVGKGGKPTAPEIKCHVIHATTTCGYKLHVPRLQQQQQQQQGDSEEEVLEEPGASLLGPKD